MTFSEMLIFSAEMLRIENLLSVKNLDCHATIDLVANANNTEIPCMTFEQCFKCFHNFLLYLDTNSLAYFRYLCYDFL